MPRMAIRKPAPPNELRVLRAARRITQRDVARRAKMPTGRYWEIENGYRAPSTSEQNAIARALRADVTAAFPEAVAS